MRFKTNQYCVMPGMEFLTGGFGIERKVLSF